MPADIKKAKPIGIQTQKDFREQNLQQIESVKIDSKLGTLKGKEPKKSKTDATLIGPQQRFDFLFFMDRDVVLKVIYKSTTPHMFSSITIDSDGICREARSGEEVFGIRWKDITSVKEKEMYLLIYDVPELKNYWE